MVFMGDMDMRGKFNMIIAEGIEPFAPAEEYMDRQDKENELKQVLGDLVKVFDLGEDGVLIVGRDGILVAGANAGDAEELLVCYLSLLCREMFIRNYFTRTFIMDDRLKRVRTLILSYQENPNYIPKLRLMLNDASKDIILLQEVLSYLNESLVTMDIPDRPEDGHEVECHLYDYLDVKTQLRDVRLRSTDLQKLVSGAEHELNNLQQMTDVINTKQLEDVFKNVESNTKFLVDASAANERASASLEIMQVILAGSFAFDIIDRLSGGTLNITVPDWVNIYIVDGLIQYPFVWFLLNMLWLGGVSQALIWLMGALGEMANGALTLRLTFNAPISTTALEAHMRTRTVEVTDSVSEASGDLKKCAYMEVDKALWQGECPKIELQWNHSFGFLLIATISVNARNTTLDEDGLIRTLKESFVASGVMTREAAGMGGEEEEREGEEGGGGASSEKKRG
jgi:WD repeat-containing protein 35